MLCPHCNTGVSFGWEELYTSLDPKNEGMGFELLCGECPECEMLVVKLEKGKISLEDAELGQELSLGEVVSDELLFPKALTRNIEPEVPDVYRNEYQEAFMVLTISPKASAALSRRILQNILRQEFSIKKSNLAKEIEDFINKGDIPTYLTDAVDAVRNIGNFAAHPLKDTSTGEIVDVEFGEAEWLLEVLDSMFDFTFVQPKRLQERKDKLNEKLKALGKPPMKS